MISEIKAEKNIPTIIPESSNLVLLKNPPKCARNQTIVNEINAPANPNNGMNRYKPRIPANMLPNAAPEDIPRIYGSAKGLFSIIWKE
jgi:hypothetical protein